MLWSPDRTFREYPFDLEAEIEEAIRVAAPALFGPGRIYLDAKKLIGAKGRTRNIPDGYLLDLTSARDPRLYVVENELAKHDPLRHIAVQILEFSLSFEADPQRVKAIVKEGLSAQAEVLRQCLQFAERNGFENVDLLLERMIYGPNRFAALVIIDELDPDLETVLVSRFKFPVEILTLQRYSTSSGECLYRFEPFLDDLAAASGESLPADDGAAVDPAEIDTIVVPARDDGFNDVFLGENRWYKIRLHPSMIPKIKHIAVYRVAPESRITHVAPVRSIEQWPDSNKYVVNFAAPAEPIGPIPVKPNGRIRPPQAPRYTSRHRLEQARTLDQVF